MGQLPLSAFLKTLKFCHVLIVENQTTPIFKFWLWDGLLYRKMTQPRPFTERSPLVLNEILLLDITEWNAFMVTFKWPSGKATTERNTFLMLQWILLICLS